MTENNNIRLIAEWEEQDAVIISWPHMDTDWNYMLEEVDNCYKNIVSAIIEYEDVIILTPEETRVQELVKGIKNDKNKIFIIKMDTNDTWVRDYGPISLELQQGNKTIKCIADFTFNGWGMKFASNKDNLINRCLYLSRTFAADVNMLNRLILVLEGGGIETDGSGTIMTTKSVIFEPNRNAGFSENDLSNIIVETLGANRINMLSHGYLEGDDTDGHIDTLARFLSPTTIAYVSCDDENDIHYHELKEMEKELQSLTNANGDKYNLVSLPLPSPIFDEQGCRLPATYANFLFVNGAIILPVYNQQYDSIVIEKFKKEFPDKQIVLVDCNALIKQHGSLHCATMQIAKGFLNRNKFN